MILSQRQSSYAVQYLSVLYNVICCIVCFSFRHRLDQELDFLVSQQIELEELLKPLEESVKQHGPDNFQEPDREREKM